MQSLRHSGGRLRVLPAPLFETVLQHVAPAQQELAHREAFFPAICNSPRTIHPSLHATRMKVRPSLSTVPQGAPCAASSNVATKILAVCISSDPLRNIPVQAAG